jgi:hypothetical protein
MSDDAGTAITGPGLCGFMNNGDTVVFGFKAGDGTEHRFNCLAPVLPEIMHGLATAGRLAEEQRHKISGEGTLEMSKLPFVVGPPGVSAITHSRNGQLPEPIIGLQLPVHLGYPLLCAMPRDTALALAQLLIEAANAPPSPRSGLQ